MTEENIKAEEKGKGNTSTTPEKVEKTQTDTKAKSEKKVAEKTKKIGAGKSKKTSKTKKQKKPLLKRLKFYSYLTIFLFFLFSGLFLSLPMWQHKLPEFVQKYLPERGADVTSSKDSKIVFDELNVRMEELSAKIANLSKQNGGVAIGNGDAVARAFSYAAKAQGNVKSLSEKINTMEGRVVDIEHKLASLKAMSSAMNGGGDVMTDGSKQSVEEIFLRLSDELSKELYNEMSSHMVEKIDTSLSSVKNEMALKADAASVEAKYESLRAQLAEVQKIAASSSSISKASSAMIIASLRLKDKVEEGKVFNDCLKDFRTAMYAEDAFKNDVVAMDAKEKIAKEVKALGAYADNGVDSITSLRERFKILAKEAVVESSSFGSDGWTAGAVKKMKSMVVIRKTEKAEKGSIDEIVYRADKYLRDRNIEAVIEIIGEIKDLKVKKVFDRWLLDAEKRLSAVKTVNSIVELCVGEKYDVDTSSLEVSSEGDVVESSMEKEQELVTQ
ncbi:MAG: hypothetical protein GY804_06060 [Alphaproteobacteria bacterium]|nr:hypothetical protein [Alphaproteobacteria bacterium]